MQAPIPPRFHGPCVHILQAEKQSVHAQTPAPCPHTRCDRLHVERVVAVLRDLQPERAEAVDAAVVGGVRALRKGAEDGLHRVIPWRAAACG